MLMVNTTSGRYFMYLNTGYTIKIWIQNKEKNTQQVIHPLVDPLMSVQKLKKKLSSKGIEHSND